MSVTAADGFFRCGGGGEGGGGGGMFVMSIFSLYLSHSFGTSYWSQTLKGSVDV